MLDKLFAKDTPIFVELSNFEEFVVGGFHARTLDISIQGLIPIRKLFVDRKLQCMSMDCEVGKKGQYCALCDKQFKCRRRIRIMMIVHNCGSMPLPAILEINQNSFESLKQAVEFIGEKNLPNKRMLVSSDYDDKKHVFLRFTPAP